MSNGAGQAASTFMDAMKSQPLSLALVVMNIGLLGFLYYEGVQAHAERQKEMEMMYEYRKNISELLYKCSPTEKK